MEIKDLEKLTIEKIDGNRVITINGEKMDLSSTIDINIHLSTESYIELETTEKTLLRW